MLSSWQSWLDRQRKKCNKFRWNGCVQPEKAASTEFTFTDHTNWEPGSHHQSLPRRLFGNFRSEKNINVEVEQSFLKHFLKEHGLYNKHQTIQQRRRLKYLLELEERTALLREDHTNVSLMASDTGLGTCLIQLHSMPYHEPNAAPKPPTSSSTVPSPKLRRGSSLSALASATDPNGNSSSDEVTVSLPSITQETKDTAKPKCLKTVSWETSSSSATKTLLETAV